MASERPADGEGSAQSPNATDSTRTTHEGLEPHASRTEEATATTTLADGRTLAWAEFGAAEGVPIVVFHGGIGSRGFGLLFEEAATELGVRLLSPDRPGYGRSDPLPGRTLLDWPPDVAAIADAAGVDRFAVLGVSGGGPYAAACAYALPERVTRAALVSTIGPPGSPKPLPMRLLMLAARVVPALPKVPLGRQLGRAREDPTAAIESRAAGKADPEVAMHRSEAGRILNASTAEAGRQGAGWAAREIGLVARPWGFDLADIAVPVGVWHGTLDRTIPAETARHMAERIPDAELTIREDVGHLSLPVTYAAEILEFLVETADAHTSGDPP